MDAGGEDSGRLRCWRLPNRLLEYRHNARVRVGLAVILDAVEGGAPVTVLGVPVLVILDLKRHLHHQAALQLEREERYVQKKQEERQ